MISWLGSRQFSEWIEVLKREVKVFLLQLGNYPPVCVFEQLKR